MAGLLFNVFGNQPRRARQYRFKTSPIYEFTDTELRARYRLGRVHCLYFQPYLRRFKAKAQKNHALRSMDQVLIALRFYTSGSFFQVIGDTFGVDIGTVSSGMIVV